MITSLVLAGLGLLNVSLVPCLLAEEHTLAFHPAPGTQMKKSMTSSWSKESEEFRVFMGGQPVPSQFLPELELASTIELETTLVDTYGEIEDGQLMAFTRLFDSLGGFGEWSVHVPPDASEGSEWDKECELAGKQVEFSWDEKAQAFDRDMAEAGEAFESLDALTGQFDLVALLPDAAVSIGDRWTADGELFAQLLSPAGALGLERRPGEDADPMDSSEMSGELQLVLRRVSKVEGVMLAIIQVEGRCELLQQRPGNLSQVPVAEGTATDTLTTDYEVEGEFIWNIDGGHAVSLMLSGSLDQGVVTVKDEGQEGGSYSSELDFSGDFEVNLEFAVVSGS